MKREELTCVKKKKLEKEKIEKANNLLGRATVLSIAVISKHMQTQTAESSRNFFPCSIV